MMMIGSTPLELISCSCCTFKWTRKDDVKAQGNNLPHILLCGHTVCGLCIKRSLRTLSVVCNKCGTPTTSDSVKSCPLNAYLVGCTQLQSKSPTVRYLPSGAPIQHAKFHKPPPKENLCCECNGQFDCQFRCPECDLVYCKPCFDKIHSFKAFQSHTKQPVGMALMKPLRCPKHKELKEFLYCEVCSIYVCHMCFLFDHRDHSFVNVNEKNEEFIPQLTEALKQAEVVRKRLLRAQKEAEKPAVRQREEIHGIEEVKRAVSEYMAQVHACLQLKEDEIFAKLGMLEQSLSLSLTDVVEDVTEKIKEVDRLMEAATYAMQPESIKNTDLSNVLKNVEKIADMPCFFTEKSSESAASVEFNEDKTILDLISKVTVEVKDGRKFCLVSEKDLPEGYEINDTHEVASADSLKDVDEYGSDISSVASIDTRKASTSSSGSTGYPEGRVGPPKGVLPQSKKQMIPAGSGPLLQLAARSKNKKRPPKNGLGDARPHAKSMRRPVPQGPVREDLAVSSLVTGDILDVKMSFANGPTSFYVQSVSSSRKRAEMNILMCRMAVNGYLPMAEEDLSGSLYLAHIKDDIWSRVRVKPSRSSTLSVEAYCVDTGVTRNVPRTSLRKLPAEVAGIPPFCAQCKLFDFHPEGTRKKHEAIDYFKRITWKRVFQMHVMGTSDEILHVDLRFKEDELAERISAGQSVRDMMLFNKYGVFLECSPRVSRDNPASDTLGSAVPNLLRPISTQNSYSIGDKFRAVCTHAESPEVVYLQRTDSKEANILPELLTNMSQEYSRGNPDDLIPSPIPGMICAALYSFDKQWYRAEIIRLCSEQMVCVRYIDFGNYERTHWTNIRLLHPRFRSLPIQIVKCAVKDLKCSSEEELDNFIKTVSNLEAEAAHVEVLGVTDDLLTVRMELVLDGKRSDLREWFEMKRKRRPGTEVSNLDASAQPPGDGVSPGTGGILGSGERISHEEEKTVVEKPVQDLVAAPGQTDENLPKRTVLEASVQFVVNGKEDEMKTGAEEPKKEEQKMTDAEERKKEEMEKTIAEERKKEDQKKMDTGKQKYTDAEKPKKEEQVETDAENPKKEEQVKTDAEKPKKEEQVKTDAEEHKKAEQKTMNAEEHREKEQENIVAEEPTAEKGSKGAVDEEKPVDKVTKPTRLKVDLVRAESPSRIFLMFSRLKLTMVKLRESMKEYYRKGKEHEENWEPVKGPSLYAFRSEDNGWYRARVINVSDDKKTVDVFLVDWGREERAPVENVRPLDAKYQNIRLTGSVHCHLADISAPGGKDVWPSASKDFFLDQLREYRNDLYMCVKGDVGNSTIPIILWVKKIVEDPLEPTTEEWFTLNKFLCEEGMALPLPGLKGDEYSCENPFEEETWNEEFVDNLESPLEVGHPEQMDESFTEEVVEIRKLECESGPLESWLPSEPLRGRFMAEVTYVDEDCHLYLHPRRRAERLAALTKELSQKYSNSAFDDNVEWKKDQICIAEYHADRKWYRAKIIDVVSPDEYVVVFVDYGNVERCKRSQLRSVTDETCHRIQCIKCLLDGIYPVFPNTNFTVEQIEYFHSMVVGKLCSVFVVRGPQEDEDFYLVDMTTEDGMPVPRYLIDKKYAVMGASRHLPKTDYPSPPYSEYDSGDDVIILAEAVSDANLKSEYLDATSATEDVQPATLVDLKASCSNANRTPSGDERVSSLSTIKGEAYVKSASIEDLINKAIVVVDNKRVDVCDPYPVGAPVLVVDEGTADICPSDSLNAPVVTTTVAAGDTISSKNVTIRETDNKIAQTNSLPLSAATSIQEVDVEILKEADSNDKGDQEKIAANDGSTIIRNDAFFPVYCNADRRLMKPSDFSSEPCKEIDHQSELLTAAAKKLSECAPANKQKLVTLGSENPETRNEAKQTENPVGPDPSVPMRQGTADWVKNLLRTRNQQTSTPPSFGRGRLVDLMKKMEN